MDVRISGRNPSDEDVLLKTDASGILKVNIDAIPATETRNYVWNPDTLAWESMKQTEVTVGALTVSGVAVSNFPASQVVKVDPMIDYDTTLSYTDTKLTGIIVTGGGKTKTLVLGYTGDNLTSITTTIS